jgi:o-succinylbenzoate synthase
MKIEFRCYQRRFNHPLQTHHGLWEVRSGIILRLHDPCGICEAARHQTSWGEIAPLEAFGSESFEQALQFCNALSIFTPNTIAQIPLHLSATRFGFESALESLHSPIERFYKRPHSTLLPTGAAALDAWRSLYAQGARTFKWKIGVAALQQELENFEALITAFPDQVQLRLDANGGLTEAEAHHWLQKCDPLRVTRRDPYGVEFLEQPLPPDQFNAMLQLSRMYQTPIALDESVTSIEQLEQCYQLGWRGIFVVKAAIAGSPARLRAFCQNHAVDIVWSSVFETAIAQSYIQNVLIPSIPSTRAIGFGVNHWFNDKLNQLDFETLWQSL